MDECKRCCYFAVTDNPDWIDKNGNPIEHCCFREWGHEDWETAPCDYSEDDFPLYEEYDDFPDDYYEGWD